MKNKKPTEKSISKLLRSGKFTDAVDECQELGEEKRKLRNFEDSIKFFEKGVKLASEMNLPFEGSFCERSLCEVHAELGNREESMLHADNFKKLSKKCGDRSQIQLSMHVKAWCIEKLYDSGSADRKDIEEGIKLAIQSRDYLEKYRKEIKKKQVHGSIVERKANLLKLEADLHQLLDRNREARRLIQEAEDTIGDYNAGIKYGILLTKCGLEEPGNRLRIAELLEECAPIKKKGNALMEHSHQLVLQNRISEGYAKIVEAYAEYSEEMPKDDLNDVEKRLPIVFKLHSYTKHLVANSSELTKCQIYEAIADLYDAYYRTMHEKEKKEHKQFIYDNIIQNYENMINHKSGLKEQLRGYLAIGLVYSEDIEDFDEALNYFERLLDLRKINNRSMSEIFDAEVSIFKCKCAQDVIGLEQMFKHLDQRITLNNSRKELYEVYASHLKKIKNESAADFYQKMADDIEPVELNNTDDESDILYKDISDGEIFDMCLDNREKQKREIEFRNKIDSKNKNGETKLHEAAKKSNAELVKSLISIGYDVNAEDYGGWTPLSEAVNYNRLENVILLINAGANVNVKSKEEMNESSSQHNSNITPLMDACHNGYVDIAEILIKHGAKLDMRDSLGKTAYDHLVDYIQRSEKRNDKQIEFLERLKSEMEKKQITPLGTNETLNFSRKRNMHFQEINNEKVIPDDDCFIVEDEPRNKGSKRRHSKHGTDSPELISKRRHFGSAQSSASRQYRKSSSPSSPFHTSLPGSSSSRPIVFDDRDNDIVHFTSPVHSVRVANSISPSMTYLSSPGSADRRYSIPISPRLILTPSQISNLSNYAIVKVIFSAPGKWKEKIKNHTFQMTSSANIEEVKTKIREYLKNENLDISFIYDNADENKCGLANDLLISNLGDNCSLVCELSPAPVSAIYRKTKDPDAELIKRLEKFEISDSLDFSNIVDDSAVSEVFEILQNHPISSDGVCLDLSRCDLTAEDELNIRKIVPNAKKLVMRSTRTSGYFENLFQSNDNFDKMETLEFSFLKMSQSKLVSILKSFQNIRKLVLIKMVMPMVSPTPLHAALKNLDNLVELDLSLTDWASSTDFELILSELPSLRKLSINHIENTFCWQPDWLPCCTFLSIREAQLDWNSFHDFLSMAPSISQIDYTSSIPSYILEFIESKLHKVSE